MNIASSAELRNRAWEAMKATWQTVLAVTFVISLVYYLVSYVLGYIPVVGSFLTLLASLATAIPSMGLVKGTMEYLRGRPLTFDCIRSMFPYWQETLKLTLWTMLCLFGWIMVGMLAMLVLSLVVTLIMGDGWQMPALVVGVVAMLWLLFRAVLNYSVSQCILVDNPGIGARNALRRSKEMMYGYRWHYVKMQLPITLLVLLIAVIGTLLGNLLPAVLASLVTSILSIAPNVASRYFMPVLYEELRRTGRWE